MTSARRQITFMSKVLFNAASTQLWLHLCSVFKDVIQCCCFFFVIYMFDVWHTSVHLCPLRTERKGTSQHVKQRDWKELWGSIMLLLALLRLRQQHHTLRCCVPISHKPVLFLRLSPRSLPRNPWKLQYFNLKSFLLLSGSLFLLTQDVTCAAD